MACLRGLRACQRGLRTCQRCMSACQRGLGACHRGLWACQKGFSGGMFGLIFGRMYGISPNHTELCPLLRPLPKKPLYHQTISHHHLPSISRLSSIDCFRLQPLSFLGSKERNSSVCLSVCTYIRPSNNPPLAGPLRNQQALGPFQQALRPFWQALSCL